MRRRLLPVALVGVLLPAAAASQSSPAPGPPKPGSGEGGQSVEVDPIRCWWRTSSGAVRIGETFSVVLTCAVLQNQAVQVVADETRLDASVAQMAPFEVIDGAHPADLYAPNRRFFQYEYRLRVINPDVIGKDVRIPDPQIHYRINSTVAANTALQGRDHTYLLPPQSVRVLSLVPADAPDIRDSAKEGFGAAEQLGFRASLLRIIAVTAMALGGLIAFLGVGRLVVRTRKEKPVGKRGLAEAAVLRLASRELDAVQRDIGPRGWNDERVGRALAALRIMAAVALGRAVHQQQGISVRPGDGQLLTGGWRRRTSTAVSGAATPDDLFRARDGLPADADPARRQLLEDLHSSLVIFTRVQYAREGGFDSTALDQALAQAIDCARRLRSEHAWPRSFFRRWTPGSRRSAVMSGAKAWHA